MMERAKEMAKQYGTGELEKTAKLLVESQNFIKSRCYKWKSC